MFSSIFWRLAVSSARRRFSTKPLNTEPPRPRTRRYIDALNALSATTRTPLPSLIASFAILHELTAIVPLVGLFFVAKAAGLGEKVVDVIRDNPETDGVASSSAIGGAVEAGWVKLRARAYVDEGEKWAASVGRRYGWWGYEKGAPVSSVKQEDLERHLAGDVANAVVAYTITKAILPIRIALSLYLSPAMSRSLIEPIRRAIMRVAPSFRRPSPGRSSRGIDS